MHKTFASTGICRYGESHRLTVANKFQRRLPPTVKASDIGRIEEYTIGGLTYKVIGKGGVGLGNGYDIAKGPEGKGYFKIDPRKRTIIGEF